MSPDARPVPRIRPVPAPDEGRDPIDTPTVTAAPGDPAPATVGAIAAPAARRARSEPTVQLNVRVAQDIEHLLDHAANQLGWTKRQLVERAIRATYGTT